MDLAQLWIRIQHFRMNTKPDPIRIQGFNDQKRKTKLQLKKINFFGSKTTIYLSQGLHKERPSYRRAFRTQETEKAFRSQKRPSNTSNMNFFLLLWVIFALLDPDPHSESGSTDPIKSGSATLVESPVRKFDDSTWSANALIILSVSLLLCSFRRLSWSFSRNMSFSVPGIS